MNINILECIYTTILIIIKIIILRRKIEDEKLILTLKKAIN